MLQRTTANRQREIESAHWLCSLINVLYSFRAAVWWLYSSLFYILSTWSPVVPIYSLHVASVTVTCLTARGGYFFWLYGSTSSGALIISELRPDNKLCLALLSLSGVWLSPWTHQGSAIITWVIGNVLERNKTIKSSHSGILLPTLHWNSGHHELFLGMWKRHKQSQVTTNVFFPEVN